ncbi:PipX family protein [Floridanema evergladense]|uniref:PipX family protein n=1 Tax=Floridaenema evergladense BLCC-F167 TaxID=3153639 RepID=A0ABV4WE58_9CYAN
MTIFHKNKFNALLDEISPPRANVNETTEHYLNHPTFGLLYGVCSLQNNQELFATIYAMRLFFVITTNGVDIQVEPVGRADARILVENYLRYLRGLGKSQEFEKVLGKYQQIFQVKTITS